MRKKPERSGASTRRSQKHRALKHLRWLIEQPDSVFALDMQTFYKNRRLSAKVWIPKVNFVQQYGLGHQALLMKRSLNGTEESVALICGQTVQLIRPKFLGAEL